MLLADCAPETVIVPVVPPLTKRSSAEVGEATKVPPGPPTLEVFQKALVPFHVPVMVLNPAVLPLTSQYRSIADAEVVKKLLTSAPQKIVVTRVEWKWNGFLDFMVLMIDLEIGGDFR
jgi:hypothetical protein